MKTHRISLSGIKRATCQICEQEAKPVWMLMQAHPSKTGNVNFLTYTFGHLVCVQRKAGTK